MFLFLCADDLMTSKYPGWSILLASERHRLNPWRPWFISVAALRYLIVRQNYHFLLLYDDQCPKKKRVCSIVHREKDLEFNFLIRFLNVSLWLYHRWAMVVHPSRHFKHGSEKRGYNKVKPKRGKPHREGALSSFYHLVKMIFICTFSTFTVLSVCAGRHLKAGGRSKRSSVFLPSGKRTQCFQVLEVVSEFKGVQNFPKAKGQVQRG